MSNSTQIITFNSKQTYENLMSTNLITKLKGILHLSYSGLQLNENNFHKYTGNANIGGTELRSQGLAWFLNSRKSQSILKINS